LAPAWENGFGNGKDLLPPIRRARAGGDDHFGPPIFNASPRSITFPVVKSTTGEFEGCVMRTTSVRPCSAQIAVVEIAVHADGAQNRMGCAGGTMDVKAAATDAVNDVLDLRFGCAFLHYDTMFRHNS